MPNQSPTIAALAKALSSFQGQVSAATKNAANPHLKNKYADLAAIWDEIRAPLAANGLAVMQAPIASDDTRLHLETVLMHESGEWCASVIVMPLQKQDPQGYGSALTYGRRYGLAAMLGITQEDDDGDRAVRGPAAQQDKPAPSRQTSPPAQAAPAAPAAQGSAPDRMAANLVRIKTAREEYQLTPPQVVSMCKRLFNKEPGEVAQSYQDTTRLLQEITSPMPA